MLSENKEQTTGSQNNKLDFKVVCSSGNKSTLKGGNEEIGLEEAIELASFGRFHAGVMIISGLCLVSMALESLGVGFILPAAQCDLELTATGKGYLSGMVFIGMVLSAHGWGLCADIFGRRKVLVTSSFGCWTFSFISSFAPTAGIFIFFRFLTGFFLSGASSTIYPYLSEFLPASNRAKMMTWTCGFVATGYFIIPGLAWVLLPVDISWDLGFIVYRSWRLYIVIMGSISLVEGLAFLYFPESPKFLMSVGKRQEALEILRYIYTLNTGNNGDNYSVKSIRYEVAASEKESNDKSDVSPKVTVTFRNLTKIMWRQTAPLFRPPYGLTTLVFCTLHIGIYMSSGGMYLWMPNLLNAMTTVENLDIIGEPPTTICEFLSYHANRTSDTSAASTVECSSVIREKVYLSTLVVGLLYVVAFGSFGGLVSMFGKRNVLVVALVSSGIAGVGSYFARNDITVTLLLSGYVVLSGTCVGVLSAAIVDSYPTNLRAMAVSLALTSGRLASGITGNVIGNLIESYCDFTIIGMGCIVIGCGILCFRLRK